jgi:4-hydroxybenzoate polyprenyltransferase
MSEAGRAPLQPVADSTGNWVDRWAPSFAQPYLRLARADRPIGSWLLLLPCWWSTALAADAAREPWPDFKLLILFAIGAIVMRGAGCTWNDILDRKLDAAVERTRSRPIPSGQVSVKAALAFLVLQALIGLAVLLQLNRFAIVTGIVSLLVVALYPLAKRVTNFPQIVLGLAFSWGALMGWAAVFGRLDPPALILYVGTIFWVIGYDTIYAHQDREDDALLGVGSTALFFGRTTKPAVAAFYAGTVVAVAIAGIGIGASAVFYAGVAAFALHLAWQVKALDINDPARCLRVVRSNRDAGLILFAGIAGDALSRAYGLIPAQ